MKSHRRALSALALMFFLPFMASGCILFESHGPTGPSDPDEERPDPDENGDGVALELPASDTLPSGGFVYFA